MKENILKKNKGIIFILILSTIFFIIQHYLLFSWDFSSYVLNAKYWFNNGTYFELMRPPLVPVIIGTLSIFGWKVAEYLFVILTSIGFMYSSIKLADSLKFNRIAFYAISTTPFLLLNGLINGTELVSLIFLELTIAYTIDDKVKSGLCLGLSALSRYTGLVLFPIFILHKSLKNIIKSIVIFALTILPWLIYNLITTGNIFSSLANQYANNVLFRAYLKQPFNFFHIIEVQNILMPFFILGLFYVIYRLICLKDIKKIFLSKADLSMLFLLTFSLYSYNNIPLKFSRYLFTLLLPTFYFAYIGIEQIAKIIKIKKQRLKITAVCMIIFLISITTICVAIPSIKNEGDIHAHFEKSTEQIKALNLEDCLLYSNAWVALNYYGMNAKPSPREFEVQKLINKGEKIIFFYEQQEPNFIFNKTYINLFPIMYQNNQYFILGNNKECTRKQPYTTSYLQGTHDSILEKTNKTMNINPCTIMFSNIEIMEKTCNMIHMKGFEIDENRVIG